MIAALEEALYPMWPRRNLQELLGIEHPLIQAPMSGITTPELASAVATLARWDRLGVGWQLAERKRVGRDEPHTVLDAMGRAVAESVGRHDGVLGQGRQVK